MCYLRWILLGLQLVFSLSLFANDENPVGKKAKNNPLASNEVASLRPRTKGLRFGPTQLQNHWLDPIRFTIESNKTEVDPGEEFELTITAELIDISPSLFFFFEEQFSYSIKLLAPPDFEQTGGDYTDFVGASLSLAQPKMVYTVKGRLTTTQNAYLSILRGPIRVTPTTLFEQKKGVLIRLKGEFPLDEKTSTPNSVSGFTASLSASSICVGQDVTFTACGCNGSVSWIGAFDSNGSCDTQTLTMTQSVYVTFSAVCSATGETIPMQLSVNSYPDPPHVGPDRTIILGLSTALVASGCSGLITWSNGQTGYSIAVAPTTTTTYTATCTYGINCTSGPSNAATVTVINCNTFTVEPQTQTICKGVSTTLSASGCINGSISWSNSQTGSSITVTPTQTTTYTAYCTANNYPNSPCPLTTASATITVVQPIAAPTISPSSAQLELGQSVTLAASGCGTGTTIWSTGATTSSITFTAPSVGTYSFTAHCFKDGCTSPDAGVTITVAVTCSSQFTVSSSRDDICPTETVTLSASGCIGNLRWYNGATDNSLTVSPAATTTFAATCEKTGCPTLTAQKQVVVNTPPDPVTISSNAANHTINMGQSITLSATGCSNGSVVWQGNGGYGGNPFVFTPTQAGTFSFDVYCDDVCLSTSTRVNVVVSPYSCDFKVTRSPDVQEIYRGEVIKFTAVKGTTMDANAAFTWNHASWKHFVADSSAVDSTQTRNGNVVYVRPLAAGNFTYRISVVGTPTCYQDIALKALKFDCACTDCTLSAVADTDNPDHTASWQGNTGFNYVIENTHLDGAGTAAKVQAKITYLDGLGRPIQQIAVKAGGYSLDQIAATATDLVNHTEYDALGRETKKYLPYATTTNGGNIIQGNLPTNIQSYYGALGKAGNPYADISYEASPLNRVIAQTAAGSSVAVQMAYRTNTAAEIKLLSYNLSTNQVAMSDYPAAQLNVTQSTNENSQVSLTYQDKGGQTVAKTISGLTTYYVYDDFGRLRCVVPPKAVSLMSSSFDPFTANDLLFAYDYDARGRMTRKKVPSAGITTMEYDVLDRLIKTTDANNNVVETEYDHLDRPTLTKLNGSQITATYYDSYGYGDKGFDLSHAYNQAKLSTPVGMATGNLTVVLNPQAGMKTSLLTSLYYDHFGRLTQTVADNHLNGTERSSMNLDFVGRATQTHQSTQGGLEIETKTAYDRASRVKATCQQVSGTGVVQAYWEPVARQHYNGIGELTRKTLGCSLQQVDYTYEMHGWLTSINNPSQLNGSTASEKDYFGMSLAYDAIGNIQTWGYQTAKRKEAYNKPYDIELRGLYTQHYTYDNLNRLKTADLDKNGSGVFAMTGSQSGIAYDANGNILAMQRTYNGTVADDLSYTFASNSNRLTSVQDNGTSTFVKNGTNSYTYDANGNLLTDSGKGVTGITYNYLNLPQQINTANGTLVYSYTATGQKLRMTVPPSGAEGAKTYDYVGSLVYENSTLEFIATAEGRVLPPDKAVNPELLPLTTILLKNSYYRYEYHLKDHLGNLRVACRCAEKAFKTSPADTYPLIAVQENHYDAWGLTLPLVETADKLSGSPEHRFTYNGKEKIADLGWLDYGARMYMPEIGRWGVVDPLAEKWNMVSSYIFTLNNPVRNIDPNGEDVIILFYATGKGEEAFRAAAQTRMDNITSGKNFDPKKDVVKMMAISDLGQMKSMVEGVVKQYSEQFGKTREVGIWSHGAWDGAIGSQATSAEYDLMAQTGRRGDFAQMTMEGYSAINYNWKEGEASMGFYGCNTGNPISGSRYAGAFAEKISDLPNMKGVQVAGQPSSSYPSFYPNSWQTSVMRSAGYFGIGETYMVGSSKEPTYQSIYPSSNSARMMNVYQNGNKIRSVHQSKGYYPF